MSNAKVITYQFSFVPIVNANKIMYSHATTNNAYATKPIKNA